MTTTLNDATVTTMALEMPRRGPWTATARVDADELQSAPSGAVLLNVEGQRFSGTVTEATEDGGEYVVRLVGGAGGLSTQLAAKNYVATQARVVLTDIVQAAGEAVSSTVESSLLDRPLGLYTRRMGTARAAVEELATELGVRWRVLADGSLWLGEDTYPEDTDTEYEVESDDEFSLVLLVEAPTVRPGETVAGTKIETVRYDLQPNGLRARVEKEDLGDLMAAIGAGSSRAVYGRLYPAQVVSQRDDGTLELKPEDPTIAGSGMDRVPLWTDPGVSVTVSPGVRVLVGFQNGKASGAFAMLAPSGSLVEELLLAGGDQFVALANLVDERLTAIQEAFDKHVHTPSAPGAVTGPPQEPPATPLIIGPLDSVAAAKVKAT